MLLIDGDMQMNLSLSFFCEDKVLEFASGSLETLKKEGGYDYILIDAPPTLGGWVMNILCASDYVILPVEASPWGLFGVANMFEFLEQVKKIASGLTLLGVVITKMDARKNYGKQTLAVLQEYDSVNVFQTIIRVDSEIEWAQDNSKPVLEYKKSARSAGEYMELAKEVDEYASGSRQH